MRMRNRNGKIGLTVAIGLLSIGVVASPAFATTEYPGGGIWNYDATFTKNYSKYFHETKSHGSSVENARYGLVRSQCQPGDIWANASQTSTGSGNKAYWRFC